MFHLGLNRFNGFNKVLSVLEVLKDLLSNFNHLYLMQIPMEPYVTIAFALSNIFTFNYWTDELF